MSEYGSFVVVVCVCGVEGTDALTSEEEDTATAPVGTGLCSVVTVKRDERGVALSVVVVVVVAVVV